MQRDWILHLHGAVKRTKLSECSNSLSICLVGHFEMACFKIVKLFNFSKCDASCCLEMY